MKKQCNYKEKCNVGKILTISICSFVIVSILMFIMVFVYYKQMQNKFEESINNTTKIVSHLQIKKEKDKNLIISTDLENLVSNLKHNDYDQFLREYYTIQIHWLNFWLTILTILLGILGIAIPICFIKFYEGKKEEISDLIQENKTVLERMKEEVKEVEKKKETMTKDLDEVKRYVEHAAESEKRIKASKNFILAIQERKKKNYKESLELINKAINLFPKNIDFILEKANVLYDMKDFNSAIVIYEQVLQKKINVSIYNSYASSLAELKKFDQAIAIFDKAIKLDPKNYRLLSNRGTCFIEKNNITEAIKDFNKALSLVQDKEDHAVLLYNITECYLRNKDFIKALNYLLKFKDLAEKPFIYDDDKPKWLNYIKEDLGKKEVSEIANLINDLKIKKRIDDEFEDTQNN